jgi:hypothetical protein
MLGDFNSAKLNIPINIRKAFDEGKIAKAYREMYNEARRMAGEEAGEYLGIEMRERLDSPIDDKRRRKTTDMLKEAQKNKDARVRYHMENMIHLLELYVRSKHDDR